MFNLQDKMPSVEENILTTTVLHNIDQRLIYDEFTESEFMIPCVSQKATF